MGTKHPWVEKTNWINSQMVAIAIPDRKQIMLFVRNASGNLAPCLLTLLSEETAEFSPDIQVQLSWDDEASFDNESDDIAEDDDIVDDDIFDDDDDDDFDDDIDDIDDDEDDDDDFDDDFDDIDIAQDEDDF